MSSFLDTDDTALLRDEMAISRTGMKAPAEPHDWPAKAKRNWSHGPCPEADFSLKSFNVLADGKQASEDWLATPPAALVWEKRRWRLLEELVSEGLPTVLAIQAGSFVDAISINLILTLSIALTTL